MANLNVKEQAQFFWKCSLSLENSWAIFLSKYFLLDTVMLGYLLFESLYVIKIKKLLSVLANIISVHYISLFSSSVESQGNPRFSHRHWRMDKGTQKLSWQDSVWEWGKGLQGINILVAGNLVIFFPEEIRLISSTETESEPRWFKSLLWYLQLQE